MKKGVVIADAGPIFSLATLDLFPILDKLFEEVYIPYAVWKEISQYEDKPFHKIICEFFENRVINIKGFNELAFVLDYGESEAILLYKELNANYLVIDDKKARDIAEYLNINCLGTLGLLVAAKKKGLIANLKPTFEKLLSNKRYYSKDLLNQILSENGEDVL